MIKIFTIILPVLLLFFGFSVQKLHAQNIEIQGYVQETVMGNQNGYSIKHITRKGLKLGAFHQSTENFSFSEKNGNYPFTGAEVSFPIVNCSQLKLYGNLKAGFVNNRYLVAVPEIETAYTVNRFMSISLASALRAGHSSLSFKVTVNPFTR